MAEVRLELDSELVAKLGSSPDDLAREIRLAAAARWYREGRLSRDEAAAFAEVEATALDQPQAAVRYSLTLFGNPAIHRVEGDGRRREVSWRLRRAFQTVAFLGLAPDQRATKDEVIEAVWPEASAETIRKNFHPTLSEARRALADGSGRRGGVVFRQGTYQLDPTFAWEVDVLASEGHIAKGRELLGREAGDREALTAWQQAWRLYRGPLLYGSDGAWVTDRREALRLRYLRLLRDLGALAERLGEQTLALDAYRSVLLEEPYEERIHLAMMELYARQGRRDLVRRQYVKLQELLQRELNVEPLDDTQERYHELMR